MSRDREIKEKGGKEKIKMEYEKRSFPDGSVVKNLPASAEDTGDMSSIPEFGRSPGNEMATHSSILALKIPWTEEPGGLPAMGFQRIRCY